ncbi:maltose O-acetyltransferase [Streptococcus sp. HSISB1]|nr:maltose O-acetyltransferase [Streptococcus sp. HSISB1]
MVEIGNNVQIPDGVTILTHGYDWSVLKGVYGNVMGSAGHVKIGNNVFIGMNSTILKGTTIGDNVIIGANSLVNKDIPSNTVVAGDPARIIMDLDTYFHKRLDVQLKEAKELVISYYEYYGEIPSKAVLSEFFWLFTDSKDNKILPKKWNETMHLVNNYNQSFKKWKESKPKFKNYDDFINWCLDDK